MEEEEKNNKIKKYQKEFTDEPPLLQELTTHAKKLQQPECSESEQYTTAAEQGHKHIPKEQPKPSFLSGTETEGVADLFGEGNTGKGLWNDEIDKIMEEENVDNYMGSFGIEDLPYIFKKIPSYKKFSFILNTGTDHWVAVNCDGYSLEFYDPLCEWKPSPQFYKDMQKALDDVPYMLKYKINNVKQQSDTTANCGYFCMRFLMERNDDISFKDATDYPKSIHENEKDIKNMKKNIGFGFI
jgi:hypothetical protein